MIPKKSLYRSEEDRLNVPLIPPPPLLPWHVFIENRGPSHTILFYLYFHCTSSRLCTELHSNTVLSLKETCSLQETGSYKVIQFGVILLGQDIVLRRKFTVGGRIQVFWKLHVCKQCPRISVQHRGNSILRTV